MLVSKCWLLNIKVSKTDVIGVLIVYRESTARVLQEAWVVMMEL